MNYEKDIEAINEAIDAIRDHDDQALDRLVHHPSPDVRVFVAKAARPKDLDLLVNDPDWEVRLAVAHYGRLEDRQKLLTDPSGIVWSEAKNNSSYQTGGRTMTPIQKAVKDNDFALAHNMLSEGLSTLIDEEIATYDDIKHIRESVNDYSIDDLEKRIANLQKKLDDYISMLESVRADVKAIAESIQDGDTSYSNPQKIELSIILKQLDDRLLTKEKAWEIIGKLNNAYIRELGTLKLPQ